MVRTHLPGMVDHADLITKAPLRDHISREPRRLDDVGRRATRHFVCSVHKFFGHPTAHADVHPREHLPLREGRLVPFRELLDHTQGLSSRHHGSLVDRVRTGRMQRYESMAAFVERRHPNRLLG